MCSWLILTRLILSVCLSAYACVAVLVRQVSGSGGVVVPEKMDTEVLDAFRLAVFWARLNEAGNAKAQSNIWSTL
jgi:hypothetical protein